MLNIKGKGATPFNTKENRELCFVVFRIPRLAFAHTGKEVFEFLHTVIMIVSMLMKHPLFFSFLPSPPLPSLSLTADADLQNGKTKDWRREKRDQKN